MDAVFSGAAFASLSRHFPLAVYTAASLLLLGFIKFIIVYNQIWNITVKNTIFDNIFSGNVFLFSTPVNVSRSEINYVRFKFLELKFTMVSHVYPNYNNGGSLYTTKVV